LVNGNKGAYKPIAPKDKLAKESWTVIVYSVKSKGFLEGANAVGVSSRGSGKMKKNPDGSVDVCFAPAAQPGIGSNWIPIGEDLLLIFRLHGPEPLLEKTWAPADTERIC
jgi:hypothetical protein